MDTEKKEEEQNSNKNENTNNNKQDENDNDNNKEENQNQQVEAIIDLPKLASQSEIRNSDVLLAIFEISTFNKKYNYECSNNTKAFWERVVEEEVLKKIFKNFKSETLRKYWKIIRSSGNNDKFIEIVRHNEKFINNPVFKLLPIINGICSYIQSNSDQKNFEDFFTSANSKEKKPVVHKEESNNVPEKKKNIKMKKVIEDKEESEKEEVDPKILKLDDIINKLMKITKKSREEVYIAYYGTSGNIKNAYLYLMDNDKYEKYFFLDTDDYIIKNLKHKNYFKELLEKKGEELIKERKKFLGINK